MNIGRGALEKISKSSCYDNMATIIGLNDIHSVKNDVYLVQFHFEITYESKL